MKSLSNLLIFTVLAFSLLNGCNSSVSPLSDRRGSVPDYKLLGVWMSNNSVHTQVYIHVMLDIHKNMRVIRITHPVSNRSDRPRIDEILVYPTRIGTLQYMNVIFRNRDKDKKEYPVKYWFFKYAVLKDGNLRIWYPRQQALIKAIEQGRLQGRHWRVGSQTRVALYSTPAQLRRWMLNARPGYELLPPEVYKRLSHSAYREY